MADLALIEINGYQAAVCRFEEGKTTGSWDIDWLLQAPCDVRLRMPGWDQAEDRPVPNGRDVEDAGLGVGARPVPVRSADPAGDHQRPFRVPGRLVGQRGRRRRGSTPPAPPFQEGRV